MSTELTLASLLVVVLVLARDWGHRRVTLFALLRPWLAAAIIIPIVAPGFSASGDGIWLEAGGLVLGVAIGLLTLAFMKISVDAGGQAWTDTGYPYAAVWVAFAAARQILIYGSQHWFTKDLGLFLFDNHISVDAFAYSIIFLFLAPVVTNRLVILIRTRNAIFNRPRPAAAGLGQIPSTDEFSHDR
jgi:hypothetical protein